MNIVYKYENLVNGKLYFGRTSQSLRKRSNGKSLTGYKDCSRFWNAICKYGPENFKATILYKNLTFEESVRIEAELINEYDTTNPDKGYNILNQEPGCGSLSEETKRKIGEANKGKYGWNKGIERTEEEKRHISEALKGKSFSEHHLEAIRKFNSSRKGKPQTYSFTEEDHKAAKEACSVKVVLNNTGEEFDSITDLANYLGTTVAYLSRLLKNNKPYKGFTFSKRI